MTDVNWLAPPWLRPRKTSRTDIQKRRELFVELVYFLFDSLLIPLIRSNFYVTESNAHKYRLFFFRHDVWRYVAEPAMVSLKSKMFSEVNLSSARQILDSRALGFSQVRLLPKETGMRPIMNLRKRVAIRGKPKQLGPGINRILAPAHTILQFEKVWCFNIFRIQLLTWKDHQPSETRFHHVLRRGYIQKGEALQG